MINTVSAQYSDIAWDVTPEAADGKLKLPAAEVQVCDVTYPMPAAEFDLKDGVVYLTPSGYIFVADEDGQPSNLEHFPNRQNYWVCAVHIVDGKEDILVLKAVLAE
jgi:hypothetical protein